MSTNPPPTRSLCVREMRIVWRDTFIVDRSTPHFLDESRAALCALPCYVADTRSEQSAMPDLLRVLERVSRSVAAVGYPNLLRFQFAPIEMASLRPTLGRLRISPQSMTMEQIAQAGMEADAAGAWIDVTPILLLHRAGVGVMEYHVVLKHASGLTPEEAIEHVRMGIHNQLLTLPESWRCLLPDGAEDWPVQHVIPSAPDRFLMVCGLRDLSQGVLAARLGMTPARPLLRRRARRSDPVTILPPRPTGSTGVVLVDVDPLPGADFAAYCAEHAVTLRGIGAMDPDYQHRAPWLVQRELGENLSTDSEMAFFLLGNSELMLFNDQLPDALKWGRKQLHLKDSLHAVTYFYMHYGVLMEWVYIQEAILRAYLQRLDILSASPSPQRRQMITTLQRALNDLIQYQENITPYATRIEFLQRAHAYQKLDQLVERFERKQELLLNYASEYHDYREARATEFLNWLAGILTGAALGDLIITLGRIRPDQLVPYLGIMLGSIAIVLAIMAFLLKRV